ncbi:MAG: peptidoglycan editing factor PgeF [Henriciella sp.]|nr:peptidoglycan editing factor PgeF [Henriciella sp.]
MTTHHLSTLPNVAHGFFGRRGGVSTGLYDSLNIGAGSGDDARAIRTNRERLSNAIGAQHLLSCFQIHSTKVVRVTKPWTTRPQADAMVTNRPGIALCILTADCVPILFADASAGIIGAAHAGWKGAMGGVAQATIEAMEALGAERSNITAAIGPAIQQTSYEVGAEFRDAFVNADQANAKFFTCDQEVEQNSPEQDPSRSEAARGSGTKIHFDLTGYVQRAVLAEGIGAVDNLGHDTCAMEEAYFSNRRRNHRGEPDYGRNGSVIMLRVTA